MSLTALKRPLTRLDWIALQAAQATLVDPLRATTDPAIIGQVSNALNAAIDAYRALRESDELWLRCMGKQTVAFLSRELGLSSAVDLQAAVVRTWTLGNSPRPAELNELIAYIEGI